MKRLLALIFTLFSSTALAQEAWPDRPIRLIVPTAAGSPLDVLARGVAHKIRDHLGQPIVIENRPGANQIIGMDACARAEPDGYTFCIANNNSWTINPLIYTKLPYDPARQLTPVALLVWVQSVITAHSDLGAKNLQDVVELSKREPTLLSWGSTGVGSNSHFYLNEITNATNWNVTHVPYSNVSQLVPAAVGNTIQLYYGSVASVSNFIRDGKLVPLAVVGNTRSRFLPDVPTLVEAGGGNFDIQTWFGIVAPAGTPDAIVRRMNEVANQVVLDPAFKTETLDILTFEPAGLPLEEVVAYLKADRDNSAAVVKAAGIRLE